MKRVGTILRHVLQHPLTRGIDLDDPRTTALRRQIIKGKPFLRKIYHEWYEQLSRDLPAGEGEVLELGSGAGFLPEVAPQVITSEIFPCPGIDLVLDGQCLPLADASLRGIVMTDVFHHLPDPRRFLSEATRTIRPGGVVAMIEPWVSAWSRLIYTKLHHEPLRTDASEWSFPTTGPLSGANMALPWIVFQRDRERFEHEFPHWHIEKIEPFMPLRYLLSGGVSLRSLVPGFSSGALKALERLIPGSAMFAHILLRRR